MTLSLVRISTVIQDKRTSRFGDLPPRGMTAVSSGFTPKELTLDMVQRYSTAMMLHGAICFLVINEIEELPELAVRSALSESSMDIYIGYTQDSDIESLLISDRVHAVDLSARSTQVPTGAQYMDFSTTEFYKIVQLKWALFETLLPRFDFLIYSDIDVIWLRDAGLYVSKTFELNPELDFLVQGFTEEIGKEKLCMGFAAMRNHTRTLDFIKGCQSAHKDEYVLNNFIGDDDIVTSQYHSLSKPAWFRELPQMYFPVGRMLNLYGTEPIFPGLAAPAPYIFHLNYVVGLTNKRLMLRLLRKLKPVSKLLKFSKFRFWHLLLLTKRVRFILGSLKKNSLFNRL